MSDRNQYSDHVTAEGTFSEVTVQHFRSDRALAQDHVIGRNRRVGQLLCYLNLMRGANLFPANAQVACKAARYQDYKSIAGNQAAHYMPGQVFIAVRGQKAQDLSYFVKDEKTKNAIGALFSRVQDLPANYNKADTYVEQFTRPGLKAILAEVCREVIREQAPSLGNRVGWIVIDSFNHWIMRSSQAYAYAIDCKTRIADLEENPVPDGTRPAILEDGTLEPHLFDPARAEAYRRAVKRNKRGETTATIWDYSEQIRILKWYLEFTKGTTLSSRIIEDVKQRFRP
ncbi:MAG: hypothetical protein GY850_27635 [bacterium]|nr:hypothetical protein [bacterium]